MRVSETRTFQVTVLCFILAVAAFLRFDHLWDRGLFYWDEAKFALEGVRYDQALRHILGLSAHLGDGKAVGTAKPTHALLGGIAYAFLGIHDYTTLYVDAACSVGAVAVTYAIGRLLFSPRVALIASGLLAVSSYEIVYARSDLSESDSCLLFLIGVWVWARSYRGAETWPARPSNRAVFVTAVVMSICFTTNYRAVVYIGIMCGADLFLVLFRVGWVSGVRRGLTWGVGLLSALLFWQVIDVVSTHVGLELFRNEFNGASRSYFEQALYQIHGGKQSGFGFEPLLYLQWFGARETVFMFVPIAVGLWIVVRRLTWPHGMVASLALLPYAAYVFAPFVVPRNIELALPFLFLVAAIGIDTVLEHRHTRVRLAATAVLAVLILADSALSWKLSRVRSGFAVAADYIRAHGDGRVITTTEVPVFYLHAVGTRCTTPALALSLSGLAAQREAGFRFALTEHHHDTHVSQYVVRHMPLAARFSALGTSDLPDDLISSENSSAPPGHSGQEYVEVYRLTVVATFHSSRVTSLSCPRDLVT